MKDYTKEIGYELLRVVDIDGFMELWNRTDTETKDKIVNGIGELAVRLVSGADTRTEPAPPIQSVMASVSDELLLRAGRYEDEAITDFDTDGVQHHLNIGRYDGLMQAVEEINKQANVALNINKC